MHPSKKTGALFIVAALSLFNAACTAQPPASGQPNASEGAHRPDGALHKNALPPPSSTPKSTAAERPSSTISIDSFVPADSKIRMEKHGDLNGDGYEDALLVLQNKEAADKESHPRTLMIIGGTPSGRPEKIIDNSSAILCTSCGGMMGDPLADITLAPGHFTIRFEGGSRELWSREYDFHYSQKDGDWILDSILEKDADRITNETTSTRLEKKDFGTVSIKNFDPETVPSD